MSDKQINIRLKSPTFKKLNNLAMKQERSVSQLVRFIIIEYLSNEKP